MTGWPGDPTSAWTTSTDWAQGHRLDHPRPIPRMDDLGKRLLKVSDVRRNRIVSIGLLVAMVIATSNVGASTSGSWEVITLVGLGVVTVGTLAVLLFLFPRRSWGSTASIAEHGVLCEMYPVPLRVLGAVPPRPGRICSSTPGRRMRRRSGSSQRSTDGRSSSRATRPPTRRCANAGDTRMLSLQRTSSARMPPADSS